MNQENCTVMSNFYITFCSSELRDLGKILLESVRDLESKTKINYIQNFRFFFFFSQIADARLVDGCKSNILLVRHDLQKLDLTTCLTVRVIL